MIVWVLNCHKLFVVVNKVGRKSYILLFYVYGVCSFVIMLWLLYEKSLR